MHTHKDKHKITHTHTLYSSQELTRTTSCSHWHTKNTNAEHINSETLTSVSSSVLKWRPVMDCVQSSCQAIKGLCLDVGVKTEKQPLKTFISCYFYEIQVGDKQPLLPSLHLLSFFAVKLMIESRIIFWPEVLCIDKHEAPGAHKKHIRTTHL